MTAVAANWLRQTRRTYFGNAAAQRDFRVQLRGNRSMLLFGLYLAVLIVVGYFKYSSISLGVQSVVQAQRELRGFYELILQMLGGMVTLVTPALAATTIVLERQRRSLDLVFSAPVPPRYYLVGKMIAVYRYIWMLLILSLPVTAACVVLGGASWSDVLTAYLLLSIHGLMFAAIGLLMSTICSKPVAAVVWTYVAVAVFQGFTGSLAGASYGYRMYGPGFGSSGAEAPFTIGLSPFSAIYVAGTYTSILGYHVPNWLLASLAILAAVRLCLLGAGALLSEGRETPNLRINWAILVAVLAFGLSYALVSTGAYGSMTAARAYDPTNFPFNAIDPASVTLGYMLFWFLAPLIFVLPNIAAYGNDGAHRQKPNGAFKLRHLLDGTPAGALPYIVGLVVLASACQLLGIKLAGGNLPSVKYFAYSLFAIGFWTLFWGITRFASSFGIGLRAARTAIVAAFVVLLALPVPFFAAVSLETFEQGGLSAWDLYLLRPVLKFRDLSVVQPLVYGLTFLLVGLALSAWGSKNWTSKGVKVNA